jgi:hypothetical protein
MGRHRLFPESKQQYDRDYWQKVRKPKEQAARERNEESFDPSWRFFDVHSFLRNVGERNYCVSMFLVDDKQKLTSYLKERGASVEQISTVFQICQDIVRE